MAKAEENAETDTAARDRELPHPVGFNGNAETDEAKSKTAKLKKELEKHVNSILQEDNYSVETIAEAVSVLSSLEKTKCSKEKNVSIPESFFRCPLSKEIMGDPVIVATGQTYDRPYIERFLKEAGKICPETKEVLPTTTVTSNTLVRNIIHHWRSPKVKADVESNPKGKEIKVAKPTEEIVHDADIGDLNLLLEELEMSSTLSDQKEAARKLRLQTKESKSFCDLFCKSGDAISRLLSPISEGRKAVAPDIEEELITTFSNISIHEGNIKLLGKNPKVIPLLIESLKFGTIETRKNAAAALASLSKFVCNAIQFGRLGAFKPLSDLLKEGDSLAMKNAASAIHCCLCLAPSSNKKFAIKEGVVKVIVEKIKAHILVDEMLAILTIFTCDYPVICQMADLVPFLLGILRDEKISNKQKEDAVSILSSLSKYVIDIRRDIEEEENANSTISNLAATGTNDVIKKAKEILHLIR